MLPWMCVHERCSSSRAICNFVVLSTSLHCWCVPSSHGGFQDEMCGHWCLPCCVPDTRSQLVIKLKFWESEDRNVDNQLCPALAPSRGRVPFLEPLLARGRERYHWDTSGTKNSCLTLTLAWIQGPSAECRGWGPRPRALQMPRQQGLAAARSAEGHRPARTPASLWRVGSIANAGFQIGRPPCVMFLYWTGVSEMTGDRLWVREHRPGHSAGCCRPSSCAVGESLPPHPQGLPPARSTLMPVQLQGLVLRAAVSSGCSKRCFVN